MADGVDWNLWVAVASLVVSVVFGMVSVVALVVSVIALMPNVQNQLHDDEEYRQEAARRLRGASLGERYRDSLRRALARLDRWFGEPGSARALGVCVWVAVAYAYASYFIGWGFGGAGNIGGFKMLPDGLVQPGRGIAAFFSMLQPVLAFYASRSVAHWVNRWEQQFEAYLLRPWLRWPQWRVLALNYRVRLGATVSILLYLLQLAGAMGEVIFHFCVFTAIPMAGALAGYHSARRIQNDFWAIVVAFIVGAIVAVVMNGALVVSVVVAAITIAIAIALTGVAPIIGTVIGTVAAGIGVLAVGVGVGATEVGSGIAVATAMGAITAGAMGTAVGMLHPQNQRRGLLWVGGFGALAGAGILFDVTEKKQAANELVLFFLLFFLILPVANGLFDWLSWWATRVLGRRLLRLLATETSGWQRGWAIAVHGLADLAIAVGLLLTMAYTLALGFEGYNELAKFQRHEAVFALRPMVDAAASSPWHTGFWLTAMLLTTLLPTFGHGLVLLGSPCGLFIPSRQRLALAEALEGYEKIDKRKQAALRRRAAGWIIHGRVMGQLAALALLVWLLGRIAAFVLLLSEGGLASVVAQAAYAGISTAEGLGRVLLGN
ncbi:MAG: hypothetical protein ACKN9T_18445 [Candidatus Methylumidiphilus sp.]